MLCWYCPVLSPRKRKSEVTVIFRNFGAPIDAHGRASCAGRAVVYSPRFFALIRGAITGITCSNYELRAEMRTTLRA